MNYVVGDIQGCYKGLIGLLNKVGFQPQHDTLWAVGDLVARGEDSLSTLDYLYDLGDSFKAVLGNHDLHLLSVIHGVKPAKPADRLEPLLNSVKISVFADWLRQFPLACKIDPNTLLTHAGLFPKWSFDDALQYSSEVERILQDDNYAQFLPTMYGSKPQSWEQVSDTPLRPVFIINALTRMRFLTASCTLNFSEKRGPDEAPSDLLPWFSINNPELKSNQRIVFGHWASLLGKTGTPSFVGLDTGYVWGGEMSCWCLETDEITRFSA